jgi:hypothetical protein
MDYFYHSIALRLRGDIKGKPHVVNGQHLKHYLAGQIFVGKRGGFNITVKGNNNEKFLRGIQKSI